MKWNKLKQKLNKYTTNNKMKKLILGMGLLLSAFAVRAQGLDSVIVEKFYVSDLADSLGSDADGAGPLPIGSVTYRIYVDMKAAYKFQALYGTEDAGGNPLHTLLLTGTKPFYNNEDRGATTPDGISLTHTKTNTVMLDSWFSVGATANGYIGLLKTEDTDGSVGNTDNLLVNTNPNAGIPIMGTGAQDGMKPGTIQSVTPVGFTTELDVFDATSLLQDTFKTTNGSIASLNGSVGPTATNRVLVGQFTTKGKFCWQLNLQIRDTVNSVIENYVAMNPTGAEMTHASLMGCDSISIFTAVQEQHAAGPAFNVYPNPVQDVLTLEINASEQNSVGSYTIYNVLGNSILHKDLGVVKVKKAEKIDMTSYPSGVYFMALTSTNGVSSYQQIIKK